MMYFDRVQEQIALMFGITPERITQDTAQDDIPEWDSVGHLNLMLAIENTFDVTLEIDQMVDLTSVVAIIEYLEKTCPPTTS
jgi:acyl carrier protein